MLEIEFYTKDICSLCEEAYALLMMLQREYPFKLKEIDIYSDDKLLEEYQLLIPAVRMEDVFLNCEEISWENIEKVLKDKVK